MSTILLVEDDQMLLGLLQAVLTGAGYKVLIENTGRGAVDCARNTRIDLLVADIVMRSMDGCEAAERITYSSPKTLVLLISGYPDESSAVRRKREWRFLEKPFWPSDLLDLVGEMLPVNRQLPA